MRPHIGTRLDHRAVRLAGTGQRRAADQRRVSCSGRAQHDEPFDVERGTGEDEERVHGREAGQLHLPQTGNGLEPRKHAFLLTHRVARMTRRVAIDRLLACAPWQYAIPDLSIPYDPSFNDLLSLKS